MIILGDIAVPNKKLAVILEDAFRVNRNIFSDQKVIFNLEGLISDHHSLKTETPILFNHPELLDLLNRQCAGSVATLANNHTLDLPDQFDETKAALHRAEVPFAGAGRSAEKASEPAVFNDGGNDVYLFNYCWDFLLYHQKNPSEDVYVAEMDVEKILEQISGHRKKYPNASLVVYFHWSLDLETLPYPMYRGFARALVDAGANLVVGCHSHCVQGGEKYKDGYIVYGLGNFFIPWNEYANGNLNFPDFSKITLALEWNPNDNETICHWFEYREDDQSLAFIESKPFEESKRLEDYSPFMDLDEREYEKYFKQYRRKSFLIPIYKDHENVFRNRILTFLLRTRAKTARKLAEINLIKWQS